ncbi:uncharacterized protein LOC108323723 [Vigna angularis]|uniref:uncharacterized protein LOC108323723 n=1 Tax=Phaseolus angularis TaxID=3914 RepID=UPI00080A7879|nr:uncharacterized protein LOC108323723 [Vigna angularis]
MARVLEKTKIEVESQKSQPLRVGGPSTFRGSFSSRRTPYSRPPSYGSRSSSSQTSMSSGHSSFSGNVRCYSCGGPHLQFVCPQMVGYRRCNICRGKGHYARDCSTVKRAECCVLFDSGATHSFVSETCVKDLGLVVRELQYDLTVSTPTSGLVKTSTLCARCSMVVEER